MISTSGRKILMQFVSDVKTLLTNNIISSLQQHYGIWADGRVIPVSQLTTSNADIIYRARMLRGRLQYIKTAFLQIVQISTKKQCNSSQPNKRSPY